MRWSIEELRIAFKLYRSFGFWNWFKELPKRVYRRTKVFLKWLFTGYTDVSLWDLGSFLEDIIIFRLGKFIKNKGMSYPTEFNNSEEWLNTLKEMRQAFINKRDNTFVSEAVESMGTTRELLEDDVGFYLRPLEDGDLKHFEEACKKQEENNIKALDMLKKYINNLWD